MKVLLTGGAGYIGSHTCVELLNAGHDVVVYDNFSNSSPIAIKRVEKLTGKTVPVIRGDVRNEKTLKNVLSENNCEAVIHFAGLKAVGESVEQPLNYYENNVFGTVSLLNAMQATKTRTIVFSSSATVYGTPQKLPLTEDHPLSATNPYGRSKLIIEEILRDLYRSDPTWKIGILRYFNPVGAHQSGLIGEDPQGIPNNLMPFIAQVAVGHRDKLNIWGNDYATDDGTGVRDYIHVVDLARGHLKALEYLKRPQCAVVNLGTGNGYSVLDVVKAFEEASSCSIAYRICPRRQGDVAACYANPNLAEQLLGWRAHLDLAAMCTDHWRWQQQNPKGYV
jgi:UDP-glucose 4-epimerase